MILSDLETYIRTAAESVEIKTFFIGYMEDMATFKGNKDYFPILRMLPNNFPVGWMNINEYDTTLDLILHKRLNDSKNTDPEDKLSDRVKDWEDTLALAENFINELQDSAYIKINNEPVIAELYADILIQEKSVSINFKLEVTLFC